MKKLLQKYKEMTFEERTVFFTGVTLCVSAAATVGKFVLGLFTDYILCVAALFNALLLFAKLECLLGIKNDKVSFEKRNLTISVLLFIAGLVYVVYMGGRLFRSVDGERYTGVQSILTAFVGFVEMGLAILGLIQTKRKGHLYRDIKIINFASAMTAIMTAQIALLSAYSQYSDAPNAYMGIGVGVITALLAVYVYFAPQISIIDREYNAFRLLDEEKNGLVDMSADETVIPLCESKIYGDYIYRAKVNGENVSGKIEKGEGFFNALPIFWKIILIILSEILIFVWLIGYVVFFCKTVNLPKQLEEKMIENGFEKILQDGSETVDK